MNRGVPMTYNRAATAVVQCLRHLDRSLGEIRLALDILSRLEQAADEAATGPAAWSGLRRPMQDFAEQLETARRALHETWAASERAAALG